MADHEVSLETAIKNGSKIALSTLILLARSKKTDPKTKLQAITEILRRGGFDPTNS